MPVRELDAHLINKIAAGEVIDRPASVVKELIENSLDAGCARIDVTVEGGGTERIQVSDDGCGMSRDDLLLAIRRHTTSKIHTEADLERIRTLGFRGEALASIVEISRTVIVSRGDDEKAARVAIEGGKIEHIRAEGRKRGTTVDVRDLFYNTPARRKFLKSERTEFTHIVRTVKRFALSHPEVHLRLVHGGKLVLESPPVRSTRDCVAHLYDAELAKALLEAKAEGQEVSVRGLVAPPQRARADRNEQYLFVNGRYVRDSALLYALSKAYEGLIDRDRYPMAFLFLEVDPQMVDVNVHPKKEEVRFSNVRLVQTELKRAVSEALLGRGAIPHLGDPGRPASPQEHVRYGAQRRLHYEELRELDLKRELRERAARRGPAGPRDEAAVPQPEAPGERIIGQLHNTYIVIQTDNGFELIDQHVAHERVLYEQYLHQLTEGHVCRQRLLIPLTLEFPPDQAEQLGDRLALLNEKLGVGLERFGGGTFILREWPEAFAQDLAKDDAVHALERLLETLEHEDDASLEELAKQMAADLACEAAVVKNTRLSTDEMQSLVARLRLTKNPYRCPHGRPIMLQYSLDALEKAFGRR